jgi:hypothetical protein
MTNAVFWDVTPCGTCKDRRFRGMYRLHYQGDNWRALTIQATRSSETLVLTRATRRNILYSESGAQSA